jgi:hypothetical protein
MKFKSFQTLKVKIFILQRKIENLLYMQLGQRNTFLKRNQFFIINFLMRIKLQEMLVFLFIVL